MDGLLTLLLVFHILVLSLLTLFSYMLMLMVQLQTTSAPVCCRSFQLSVTSASYGTEYTIGVNSYWAQGLKPPHFYDHGARIYDEPPTFVT